MNDDTRGRFAGVTRSRLFKHAEDAGRNLPRDLDVAEQVADDGHRSRGDYASRDDQQQENPVLVDAHERMTTADL